MQERLSKYLANSGLGARRKMETYIDAGRVSVNGKIITTQGYKVDPQNDTVHVDGLLVEKKTEHTYVIVNKPAGYLCTAGRQEKRKKVHDLLPESLEQREELVIVGRLDKNSEGLLLMTDDGEVAHKMMHPRYEKEKEYYVIVRGEITEEAMETLRTGVEIEVEGQPYLTRPADVYLKQRDRKSSIRIVLREGKKRQIRLMCAKVGYPVTYLSRTRVGKIHMGTLGRGEWRHLTQEEINYLRT